MESNPSPLFDDEMTSTFDFEKNLARIEILFLERCNGIMLRFEQAEREILEKKKSDIQYQILNSSNSSESLPRATSMSGIYTI